MSQYGVSFVATVYAWDTSAGTYKTGDSANITLYWDKDGTNTVTTNACSEVSSANVPGQYKVTMTSTEAQCTAGTLGGKSSTANIIIIPAQFTFEQYPTNFSSLSIDGSGRVDVAKVAGTAQTARDLGASVLISSGTGTGQLDVTSGVIKANLAQILGTALTETAGQLAAAFKKFFNIATPAATMDHLVLVDTVTTATTATNLTNAPTNGDLTATMKTSVTTAATAATPVAASVTGNVGGNVVGSVASVTGAVGSVTGNVGGNVVGSVASVTGAVGSVTATVNADVKKINAVTITGAGTLGNEFHP